ncbi:MAG: aconitate hydratase, partial [Chloroflexota bacterium]
MAEALDHFGTRAVLGGGPNSPTYYSLAALGRSGISGIDRLPFTVKVLLENTLRHFSSGLLKEDDVLSLARWNPAGKEAREFPFTPGRVVMQDFTGVP